MSDYVENKSLNVLRGGIKNDKPSTNEMSQGQLAVNYRKGHETIFTKNSEDRIVEFEGGEGGNDFITLRHESFEQDGIFPDKQRLYDCIRDRRDTGNYLFEPEEGKMCVAFVQGDNGIETYPIISPEPSYDSLVDPEKTKKADDVKVGKKPYGGNKIVVRRHIKQKPWVGLPYYFQDGICVFRENFEYTGAKFVFKYDSNFIHFEDVKAYISVEAYFDIEIEDISEGRCDKQLTVTMYAGGHHWAMIRFHMNGYNVFEATNRICPDPHVFILDERHVKLGHISDDEYRTRETLSPYLKLEWANYISYSEGGKPKLVNIRPSLWRGYIDNLEERIYPNRETEKYNLFISNIFGRGGLYPRPRYTIRSKIRNNIPIYSQSDYRRANMPCLYPEIYGGKLIIHYMAWMIEDIIDAHQIDLSDEYLHVSLKNKLTGFGSGSVGVKIYLNQLDLSKNYTEFEATDFPQLANIENVFYCYEINYDFTRCCHGDYHYPSEYFGTTSQFCPRRTSRFVHKLSRWNWCKDGEEVKIIKGEGRYRENKSYSLLLYKKHRGVISKYPCHLSVIRTAKTPVVVPDYLTFDIISGGTINWSFVNMDGDATKTGRDLDYSLNNGDWTTINSTNGAVIYVNDGDVVRFRGKFDNYEDQTMAAYSTFRDSTATFNVKGNIMSLLDYENMENDTAGAFAFEYLFYRTNIIESHELKMPTYEVGNYGLSFTFGYCEKMITAPTLPATELGAFAYDETFLGCTLLTTVQNILPAIDLPDAAYNGMYAHCTSLVTAPEIMAETARYASFNSMFKGCTSLTTVQDSFYFDKAATYCCWRMFDTCTSLTKAPKLTATTLDSYCYEYMFTNCTSLTSVYKLPATEAKIYCYHSMFEGCTALTTVPSDMISAANVSHQSYCYKTMFAGCTSLTNAPELPSMHVGYGSYFGMFQGCSSLTTVPVNYLPATSVPDWAYHEMFRGCTSLTNTPKLPAISIGEYCYRYMFQGCTSLTTVPSDMLPATNLTSYCYDGMFADCSSLTTAPDLPATILKERCYMGMFDRCTNLNYIKCLATDITAEDCTNAWVRDVASTGIFVKSPDMNDWATGISGIPSGWSVQNGS